MFIHLVLLAAITVTSLPDGKVGQDYKASIGDGLSGCIIHSNGKPYRGNATHVLPSGLKLSKEGVVTGVPKRADDYEFDVVCKELKGRFSISVSE